MDISIYSTFSPTAFSPTDNKLGKWLELPPGFALELLVTHMEPHVQMVPEWPVLGTLKYTQKEMTFGSIKTYLSASSTENVLAVITGTHLELKWLLCVAIFISIC